MTEIPEEAVQKAARLLFDAEWREGDWYWEQYPEPNRWQMLAGQVVAAALPHLRVQETPPVVSAQAVSDVLREFANGEPVDDDGWVLFADELSDFHGALLAAGVFAPAPRPVVDRRELLKLLEREGVTTTRVMGELAYRQELADAILALLPTEEVAGGQEDPQRTDPAPTEDPEQAPRAGHRRVREPAQPADAEELAETRPTTGLTEEDTKALVETATRLGVELGKAEGRKQALEEAATALEAVESPKYAGDLSSGLGWMLISREMAIIAVQRLSAASGATSDGLTATDGYTDLPEGSRASSIRIPRGEG